MYNKYTLCRRDNILNIKRGKPKKNKIELIY